MRVTLAFLFSECSVFTKHLDYREHFQIHVGCIKGYLKSPAAGDEEGFCHMQLYMTKDDLILNLNSTK